MFYDSLVLVPAGSALGDILGLPGATSDAERTLRRSLHRPGAGWAEHRPAHGRPSGRLLGPHSKQVNQTANLLPRLWLCSTLQLEPKNGARSR